MQNRILLRIFGLINIYSMSIFDKIKSFFSSDEQLMAAHGHAAYRVDQASLVVPAVITEEAVYEALVEYGRQAGYIDPQRAVQRNSDALMASVKNQVIKMHEEILKAYEKQNMSPDEKLLNRLTIENMFFLSMGTAILAKVKKTNLIAQGFFGKLLKKSGPEFFYREVLAMAGHKYGDETSEAIHTHVQRAAYLLLSSFDNQSDCRSLAIICAKAMYMYGLAVTLRTKK